MNKSRFRFRASAAAASIMIASASLAASLGTANPPDKKPDADSEKPEGGKFEPFKAEAITSTGSVTIGGQAISYQAIAGTLIVHPKDWDDVPRDPKADKGGPGAAEEGADSEESDRRSLGVLCRLFQDPGQVRGR